METDRFLHQSRTPKTIKMKTYFYLLVFLGNSAFSQEQINQFDNNGKKHGLWEIYESAQWKDLPSPEGAEYIRYTYYDHGTDLSSMGQLAMKKHKIVHEGPKEETLKGLKLMSGTYKVYDPKGNLQFIHELKDGHYTAYKEFGKKGELKTDIDFTQRYMEQPHTYKITSYDKKGVTVFFFQNTDKWGWLAYQAPFEPDSISKTELKTSGDTVFVSEKWYRNGRLDNEVEKIYFKDGGNGFFDGMYHGKYLAWYGNGNKEHEGIYRYGMPLVGWKSWNADGTLREEKK